MKILIIDGDEAATARLARELVNRGHEVALEVSGPKGIKKIEQTPGFDIIITDIDLDKIIDGWDVLLIARAVGSKATRVLMSERDNSDIRTNVRETGVDALLRRNEIITFVDRKTIEKDNQTIIQG